MNRSIECSEEKNFITIAKALLAENYEIRVKRDSCSVYMIDYEWRDGEKFFARFDETTGETCDD